MTYKAKIWIEEGQILCCSQMCEGCDEEYRCKAVIVEIKEEKENLEVAS